MAKTKKKNKAEPRKKGAYTPNKVDVEAFAQGTLTPKAKKLNKVVDRAFRYHHWFLKALALYENRMRSLAESIGADKVGATVRSVDEQRQVVFQISHPKRGNANAKAAKVLIDEYVAEMLASKNTTEDQKRMAEFLSDVITESRGKILQTASMVKFGRTVFTDPRLKKAQVLLRDAFDVGAPKLAFYVSVLDEERDKFVAPTLKWMENGQ